MQITVIFPVKFCESNLEKFIKLYWDKSKNENYESLIFDLTVLEWISIEEITFLFSWIRHLKLQGKIVKVILPYQYDLTNYENIAKTLKIEYAEEIKSDNEDRRLRRKRLNLFLLSIWKMLTRVGLSSNDFQNIIDNYNKLDDQLKETSFSKRVIPFTILNSSHSKKEKVKVDNVFESALKGDKTILFSVESEESINNILFYLDTEIIELLTKFSCFSPFESKIISHIITKELFINSIEHSAASECYFTIALENKWEHSTGRKFINRFIDEKDPATIDFFKDKEKIFIEIENTINNRNNLNIDKQPSYRETDLSRYDKYFRNLSYVEFTFIDYGKGIYKSLEPEFIKNKENISELLSEKANEKHEHSQILEYAFLIESSKNPYDREIEYSELIPRGLYFLIDMVRRFKGLIVARSGFGKVVYDFSDKIYLKKIDNKLIPIKERIYQAKESVREFKDDLTFFDGTMISIVLPERHIDSLRLTPVRVDDKILNHYIFNLDKNQDVFPPSFYQPERIEYISLVFLHQEAINKLTYEELNEKVGLDNYIFKAIDEKLKELKGVKSLLFIDFEFLYERANYLKIITWLTNTPKVNEFTKVIIVNLTKEESSVLEEFKENLSQRVVFRETAFIYKPIPCLNLKKIPGEDIVKDDIQWVGIMNNTDEALLTNLIFGSKDRYPIGHFSNSSVTEGHSVSKFQDYVYSNFTSLYDIVNYYYKSKFSFLKTWIIENEIINGNRPKTGDKQHVFLTSRGGYQKCYISLYETLHNKYISKLFAKLLLDKFIQKQFDLGKNRDSIFIDKIIVVTVCSQLIGVGIKDIINGDENESDSHEINKYRFLGKKIVNGEIQSTNLKLIRLASYYSFDTEKPFNEIIQNDNVIIVNDVISTGSLIERLILGISEKKAAINSVMTIVDSRFDEIISVDEEIKPVFFEEHFEKNVITAILSSKEESELRIKKYTQKIPGDFETKRINPILNTVVELKYSHSEKDRVLYKNLSEFANEPFSKNEIYKIGHFQQGLTHNGFYTDMSKLFYKENGKNILTAVKLKIENNIHHLKLSSHETTKIRLKNAWNNLEVLNIDEEEINISVDNLKKAITAVLEDYDNKLLLQNLKSEEYNPDFIIHPVFSGIEIVSDKTFHEVFGTPVDNIISLQRYETRNGWRFPFPAKRYNKLTKGKHVLIVDSGSLTGDSLVQLIDSIAFLEVGRIDFLSIVGRLDDFQREFYSRLKSIKVKKYSQGKKEEKELDSIVNLNILFGINVHIPPYGSKLACPFCQEFEELEAFEKRFKNKEMPNRTKNYIYNRLKYEIKLIKQNEDIYIPRYLPTLKDHPGNLPDFKEIFIMRDKIGKVESYRFYEEYFEPFNITQSELSINIFSNKEIIRHYELILTCILHEPSLFGVIKDLLANIYIVLCYIIEVTVFAKELRIKDFYYKWPEYSLIRLAVIFKEDSLYETNIMNELLTFASDSEDDNGLDYISFLLTKAFFEDSKSNVANRETPSILNFLFESTKNKKNEKVYDLVRKITQLYEKTIIGNVVDAFSNLNRFFIREGSVSSHSALENLYSSLRRNISNPKLIKDKKELIFNDLYDIKNSLNESIFTNLVKIKETENLKRCYEVEYNRIFNGNSIYSEMTDLFKEFDQLDETKETYLSQLERVARQYSSFQFKYLVDDNSNIHSFIKFCRAFDANLKFCISEALQSNEVKRISEILKNWEYRIDWESCDLNINIHSTILINSFKEIFKNAAKFAETINDQFVITIKVKRGDLKNMLIINQNHPFVNPNNISRGTKDIIEKCFVTFFGQNNYKIEEAPLYKITVSF